MRRCRRTRKPQAENLLLRAGEPPNFSVLCDSGHKYPNTSRSFLMISGWESTVIFRTTLFELLLEWFKSQSYLLALRAKDALRSATDTALVCLKPSLFCRLQLLNTCGRGSMLRRLPRRPGDPQPNKFQCSVPDRIYGFLLRELPGRAVGVEATDKSAFLVAGAVTGPVDAFDSEPRSRWH